MAATPENLQLMARRLPQDCVWQIIAIGRENLRLTAIGLALGGNARAGMEDTLYSKKGELAASSAQLVTRAVTLVDALDGAVASVAEARQRLIGDATR